MKMFITAAIMIATLTSCNYTVSGSNSGELIGSSETQTRTVEVLPFDDLTINIPCDVVYELGAPKIVIVASEKYMNHIVVDQDNDGSVTIKTDDKRIRSFRNTKVYITSDVLSVLSINGAVDMECKHGIRSTGDFSLTLNGAGDLDIAGLDATNVTVRCNGAADLELSGLRATSLEVTMNGAGDVNVGGRVDSARLTINGAGDIDATQLEAASIRPSVNGIGSIRTQ
jgi:hypothetical protein